MVARVRFRRGVPMEIVRFAKEIWLAKNARIALLSHVIIATQMMESMLSTRLKAEPMMWPSASLVGAVPGDVICRNSLWQTSPLLQLNIMSQNH